MYEVVKLLSTASVYVGMAVHGEAAEQAGLAKSSAEKVRISWNIAAQQGRSFSSGQQLATGGSIHCKSVSTIWTQQSRLRQLALRNKMDITRIGIRSWKSKFFRTSQKKNKRNLVAPYLFLFILAFALTSNKHTHTHTVTSVHKRHKKKELVSLGNPAKPPRVPNYARMSLQ